MLAVGRCTVRGNVRDGGRSLAKEATGDRVKFAILFFTLYFLPPWVSCEEGRKVAFSGLDKRFLKKLVQASI